MAQDAALPPLPLDQHGAWQAVGRVNVAGHRTRAMCTGSLVAPNVVLTAAHCLIRDDGRAYQISDLRFVAGWLRGDFAAQAGVTHTLIHPRAIQNGRIDPRGDLALMVLDRPLGDIAPLPIAADPMGRQAYGLVGYHWSRPHMLSARFDCGAQPRGGHLMMVACPVQPGNSGGPVLRRENGVWSVAAVASARSGEFLLAVRIDDWVRQTMREIAEKAL